MNTVAVMRMRALGRAELTLLWRSKTALFSALLAPLLITVAAQSAVAKVDLSGTGLSVGTVLLPAAMGFVLIFAVYSNLVGIYVSRREELVLKRLRTGEASDWEILVGSALPLMAVALLQDVVLIVAAATVLDLTPPARPDLVAAGLLLGIAVMVALAALSTVVTRSTEAAQLTPMPLLMVSMLGSGIFLPLETLPDTVADVCRFLPMTPVMELLRGGWVGTLDAAQALRALGIAAAWTLLAMAGVRRWFRWEPRR